MKRRRRQSVVRMIQGMALGLWLMGAGPRAGQASSPASEGLQWPLDAEMPRDVFTFVRIEYSTWRGWDYRWRTDYPDADLNLSYRLQQVTSLKVHPQGKTMRITDPALSQYPFIYIVEPGDLHFSDAEVSTLRRYLFRGGFLMVDDFWGEAEWFNFYTEIKRVFPDREPKELPIEHPIFNNVFKIARKPQIPSISYARQAELYGITWERSDAKEVHYKGIFDDKGRLMVVICHNTDLGDGWEREGEDHYYFREFSEKKAYPLAINIIFYAMTH